MLKIKAVYSALCAAGIFVCQAAEPKVVFNAEKTFTQASVTSKSPKIDGKIRNDEYFGSFENFGLLIQKKAHLSSRQGKYFAALDNQYLYLAFQSELPDKESGVKLQTLYKRRDSKIYMDDSVDILFATPDKDMVYHLIINSKNYIYDYKYPIINGDADPSKAVNWNPDIKIASSFKNNMWTFELRIPLKDININTLKTPANWKFQFGRTWKNPHEISAMNKVLYFVQPAEMNDVAFDNSSPVVRFATIGSNYRKGENEITFAIDNPTAKPQKVKYSVSVASEAAPRSKEDTVTVAPGATEKIVLAYKDTAKLNNDLKAVFFDEKGKILYKRTFQWQYPVPARWIAPDVKNSAELEFGIYPYYNKARLRLGNPSLPYDMRKVVSANAFIADSKGVQIGKKYPASVTQNVGFTAEIPLNLKNKGVYNVVMEINGKDNKKTIFKQKFNFDKFEWEHNKLGTERVVLPPYLPLKYDNNKIKTLTAEYTLANGFPATAKAGQADALLASPVTLKINGQVPQEKSFKWQEKSDDLGISVTELALDGLNLSVKNEFEFDNFIKTTLTVVPQTSFNFKTMTLDIPLNGKFASQLHSTCNRMRQNDAKALPTTDGEIWNSTQSVSHPEVYNNFRPYIWIGKLGEGLAFFTESDKNWSRNDKKPMAQIFRRNGVVTLRINFIDLPTVRKEPFKLVFGFQSTPTRIRPNIVRSYSGRGINAPNTVIGAVLAGSKAWSGVEFDFAPWGNDYSYINGLKNIMTDPAKYDKKYAEKISQEFLDRNCKNLDKDLYNRFKTHLGWGVAHARRSKYLIPYLNPRATQFRWNEYNVFMDEWYCSEYRANTEDAYNTTPTRSYQDYVLYQCNKLLDAGLNGLYYDNIRDWHNVNSVTGDAYRLPSGKLQPYFDIFDMRTLIKRTAVMLYKKGYTFFDGRPVLYLHMTNTNLIPFTSLGGINLECEANYGNADFQDRFSEDYMEISACGLQSGSIPEVLVQITGSNKDFVTRTFVATILAFDINSVMTAGGVGKDYYRTVYNLRNFGYGSEKVKVYPSYAPSGDIKADVPVRITEYRRNDGQRMIAVSSFGYAGKVKLSWNFKAKVAMNAENGAKFSTTDGKSIEFELKKHDFTLIRTTE